MKHPISSIMMKMPKLYHIVGTVCSQKFLYYISRITNRERLCRYGLYTEKKFPDKPALVVELKWNQSAEGAIDQIKKKKNVKSLEEYECVIEEWEE